VASIVRRDDEIVLVLSTGEHILSTHRDVHVPVSAVTSVEVVERPLDLVAIRDGHIRRLGGRAPGWFAYGSFFDGSIRRKLFAAVARQPRGLEIRLEGAAYTRLIVGLDDPEIIKAGLSLEA
jgi:hypothetical protein